MTTSYECHVFAHKGGRYQTTHVSTGVISSERAALEQFFFGQTNDEQYLASLARDPGVIWRRVDARYALTRVLAGKKDANGRATLRFETMLIPTNTSPVADKLAELVRSTWRFSREGASLTDSVEARPEELHMDKVSSVVLHFRECKRTVARATTFSLRDVEKIVSLCRNDPAFSLCYKSLNERAPVAVNLVFGNISERQIMTRATTMPPHPKPERVGTVPSTSPSTGSLVAIALFLVIVMQIITLFVVRSSNGASPTDTMQKHIIARIESKAQEGSKERDEHLKEVSMKMERTTDKLAAVEKQLTAGSAALERVQRALNEVRKLASTHDDGVRQLVRDLENRIDETFRRHRTELEKALDSQQEKAIGSLVRGQKRITDSLTELKDRLGPFGTIEKGERSPEQRR